MQHLAVIRPDGTLEFIYADELRPLFEAGELAIRRASHVEPTPDGRWHVDLAPVGGAVLGPFNLREQALEAERAWLTAYFLTCPQAD